MESTAVPEQAMAAAHALAQRYMERLGGDFIDGRVLIRVAAAGYLAASGVPTDQAVEAVERMAARVMVSPTPANPIYQGIPWLVAGPASGVPYYAGR